MPTSLVAAFSMRNRISGRTRNKYTLGLISIPFSFHERSFQEVAEPVMSLLCEAWRSFGNLRCVPL